MSRFSVCRRRALALLGAVGTGVVAGCAGDGDPGDEAEAPGGDDSDDDREETTDEEVEQNHEDSGESDSNDGESDGQPALSIEELAVTPDSLKQTDTVSVESTLRNSGDGPGEASVELRYGHEVVSKESVFLAAGESEEVENTLEALRPGERTVTVELTTDEGAIDASERNLTVAEYPESFVDVAGTTFTVDEETFFVSGAEPKPPYVNGVTHPHVDELREIIFDGLEQIDATVARLHGYSYASVEEGTPFPGEDNEEFFKLFDRAIVEAKRRGIRLSVNLINGAPHYHQDPEDHFGMHVPAFVHHVDSAEEIDDFFVNDECIQLYKDWVTELLTRENDITGVEYRNDPTIMMWELGNEIQWEAGWERADGPSLRPWIEEVAPHVQEVMNGNQLLTTGIHGWPEGRNDFYNDHAPESIDVCSIHWWAPGPLHYSDYTPEESDALFDELVETAHEVLQKPIWIGEYNWGYGEHTVPAEVDEELLATRNESLQHWHDRFDEEDVAGVALHELGSKEINEEIHDNPGPGSSTVYADAHDGTVAELQRYADRVRTKSGGEPPEESRQTYHISPDGHDDNSGSESEPLRRIEEGLQRARPGDTIHVAPGVYREEVHTERGGRPGDPITITGPPDAVWKAHEFTNTLFDVAHSHIHVKGLTMDGLINEDQAFETSDAYAGTIVNISPWRTHLDDELESVDYLEDIVIEPARIGNCTGNMIFVTRLQGGSIGGFEVIGPAGMDFHPDVEDPIESHVGEILYVGTTVDDLDERYPWDSLDRTRDLRIHNIDNSEGYHHSQFIDLKIGTENIIVENCTDRGAGQTTDAATAGAIDIKGNDHTIRWNDLGECLWGMQFGAWVPEPHDHHADAGDWARYNEVYGNYIHGFSEGALRFYDARDVTPEDQDVLCGNEIEDDDETYEYATESCGVDIPEGDGIGAT